MWSISWQKARASRSVPVVHALLAVGIEPLHDHPRGPHRRAAVTPGTERQPSSSRCSPSLLHELRVHELDELPGVLADREVDHDDAQGDADLRRGQADAGRGVHGLDHVVEERVDRAVDLASRARRARAAPGSPYFTMGRMGHRPQSYASARGRQRRARNSRHRAAGGLQVVEQLGEGVAAELLEQRVGEHPGHHRPRRPRPRRAPRRCRCAPPRPCCGSLVRRSIERSGMHERRDGLHHRLARAAPRRW